MKKIRIATWNISCGIPAKWNLSDGIKKEENYENFGLVDEVIQKINEENIDIIGIQESVSFKNGKKSYAQIISEATNLKYYKTFKVSDCHLLENANIEEVLLSRYPITKATNVMFENANLQIIGKDGKTYKQFDFGFIISNIQINNIPITFVTGHAPAFHVFGREPEDYQYIYKRLEDNIEKVMQDNKKVFIVGDYNTENLLQLLPFIKNNFNNYIKGKTNFKGKSIDYILAQKDITCLSDKKIENKSDHLLCIADFEI